jgi:hypothetical protein
MTLEQTEGITNYGALSGDSEEKSTCQAILEAYNGDIHSCCGCFPRPVQAKRHAFKLGYLSASRLLAVSYSNISFVKSNLTILIPVSIKDFLGTYLA